MESQLDIEARPIEPFRGKPIVVQELPGWISDLKLSEVTVSLLDRGAVFFVRVGEFTKTAFMLIQVSVIIAGGIQKLSEVKMDFKSRTTWAIIIGILAGVLGIFGKQIDAAAQSQIVDVIVSLIQYGGGFIAAVLVIIHKIWPKAPPAPVIQQLVAAKTETEVHAALGTRPK